MELGLHDLTGFDGRCDAIYFASIDEGQTVEPPPNVSEPLADWRREVLGLTEAPIARTGYDLVVVGGGYAGMGAAISAARMGCKVALIQDRPVLGGNGSSEVRVWAMGNIRRGRYPHLGEIIEEFADKATKSPGRAEEFGDEQKEAIVRAEKNIDLFLNHHAFACENENGKLISVQTFDTRTSQHSEFFGKLFCDCTGHETVGILAEADWEMEPKDRMGMSNMWTWAEVDQVTDFPKTPWALELQMADFPYPRDHHGQWFWESGFNKNAVADAEGIRDHNLRAVYGAFNAMKNNDGAEKHRNAVLTWVAFIGGPRESRRLLGDVILSQEDVITKREFDDGCVPSTWSIDLHYPKKQYAEKFPDNPFISIAIHDRRIDREYGYPVPYRCFYSRNVDNLFMAGRNIGVTHQALGTTRVMKTCGMMGEVVGRAANICVKHACQPRDVYETHIEELIELLKLPGTTRHKSVGGSDTVDANAVSAIKTHDASSGKLEYSSQSK
ncbi:tRNA uridine 5-carboxymethylaminomethyl modification enzyme GidA [Planctomycetes bacterium CA13]|uniref:tRNA uridine 5-carboxymethylaminomethyl modification enzyme GidA n=1 Tax=Novipirellula herctigrandis TaxID=2527986 RepID=A0A5C5Z8Z8_9BACT|nr:tRNA uridine 5-carboxymethylaminomethyl modification enzyme GidA [Planctomycetes bacterium CA13]